MEMLEQLVVLMCDSQVHELWNTGLNPAQDLTCKNDHSTYEQNKKPDFSVFF